MQQALLTAEGKGTSRRQTWCRAGHRLAQPAPRQPLPTEQWGGEQPAVGKGSRKVIQNCIVTRVICVTDG